jgi:acyl dehydratase
MSDSPPADFTPRYFDDVEEGEQFTVEDARTITEADVANFAGLTGDFYPLHLSEPHAAKTRFGERVVPGNLVFVLTEGIVCGAFPMGYTHGVHGVASYGHDHLRFVEPVTIGDTLSVSAEVLDTEPYDERSGLVRYEYRTRNQNGDVVLVDEHLSLKQRREPTPTDSGAGDRNE